MLSNNIHALLLRQRHLYLFDTYKQYGLNSLKDNTNNIILSSNTNRLDFVAKQISVNHQNDVRVWRKKVKAYTPYVPNGSSMYFTIDDYLSSGKERYTINTMNPKHYANAISLLNKVNELGELISYNGQITSGYRSPERQKQIYAEKGEPPAMGSKHLSGHAMDIYDPDGSLKRKILNTSVLEKARDLGLYFENFGNTPTWVHIQDEAPVFTGGQIWSADNLLDKNRL